MTEQEQRAIDLVKAMQAVSQAVAMQEDAVDRLANASKRFEAARTAMAHFPKIELVYDGYIVKVDQDKEVEVRKVTVIPIQSILSVM